MAILQTVKTFFGARIIALFLPHCTHIRKRTPGQLENNNQQITQKGNYDNIPCTVDLPGYTKIK